MQKATTLFLHFPHHGTETIPVLHLRCTAVSDGLFLPFSIAHSCTWEPPRQDTLAGSAVRGGEALPAQRECGLRGQLRWARLLLQESPERGRRSRAQPGLGGHGVHGAGAGLSALQKVFNIP